ncbi:hypothetical protein ID866_7515, partial [Astraeus odoratus]
MQEAEEQDTCRICSAPGEPGQPLFYPCKCSGTIRYIHQDCLTTWLSHSKKKTCDVCKHPYSFTKVYASDMPATLPPLLLVRRLAQQTLFGVLFGLRAVMIAIVWLAVLPWITIWTWRLYFTMGESTAWWISGRERQLDSSQSGLANLAAGNETTSFWRNVTIFHRLATRPFWQSLSADIFAGQIIASLIVLTFVAVFLLREWISQNARPGVFEEEDMGGAVGVVPQVVDPPVLQPMPPIQRPVEPNGRLGQARIPFDGDQEDLQRRLRPVRPRRAAVPDGQLERLPRRPDEIERAAPIRDLAVPAPEFPAVDAQPAPENDERLAFGKGKAREDDTVDDEGYARVRPRIRRRLDPDAQNGVAHEDASAASTSTSTSTSGTHPSPPAASSSSGIQPATFEFTFRAPRLTNGYMLEHQAGPAAAAPTHTLAEAARGTEDANALGRGPIEQSPPAAHAYYSALSSSRDPGPSLNPEPEEPLSSHVQAGSTLRRPPMMSSTVMAEDEERRLQPTPPFTNTPSPKLATYAAPEELEAGPSSFMPPRLVERDHLVEMTEEFAHYFREDEPVVVNDKDLVPDYNGGGPGQDGEAEQEVAVEEEDEDDEGDGEVEGDDLHEQDLWDVDGDRDEDDEDDELDNLNLVNRPGLQAQQAQLQEAVEQLGDVADDLEAGVEDDMEGALEAIGLRGPIFGVVQNAVLMILVLDTAIGFGVWLPFTLGKTTALLTLDPPRALHILHLPIRAMRVITDPVVDTVTFLLSRSVLPVFYMAVELMFRCALLGVEKLGGPSVAATAAELPAWMALRAAYLSEKLIEWLRSPPEEPAPGLSSHIDKFFESDSAIARFLEPYFARFGRDIRLFNEQAHTAWVELTLGNGTPEPGCRNIMRPGAMWFIKDPQDQNFHPIRDILDRPTLTQFRKLLVSAFMYSMVVACGVGSLAILLFIGSKSIFPIRWKTREPLSDVPIDLLFLQIVLPYTMRYLRPRRIIYKASGHVWRFLAARLRLTSYMFGERHQCQESTTRYRTWAAFFRRSAKDMQEIVVERDGTFRRVPASDNIALPRDMRATAEVLENGEPANDSAKDLINLQNNEAVKAKRDIRTDYIVVYFPPHFRARILSFIAAVWIIVAVVVAVCMALPIQIGRRFFALFTSSELHDGYSFLAGFYLLWACYAIAHAADRMNKRRLRMASKDPKPDFMVYFVKRSLIWFSKIAYMAICLGIVIPTLIGLVADLYIILPVRLTLNPAMVPKIRIVDMWSLGLVYGKIAIRLRRRIQLPGRLSQALQTLLNNGWSNPDVGHTTKELILPLTAGLLGMLAVPAGFVYILREVLEIPLSSKFLFVHAYPGIFAAAGLS